MAKSLLTILKNKQPSKETSLDIDKRLAPHRHDVQVRNVLRKLVVRDNGYPYDNKDAFTASKVKTFDRGANRYGHDNIEYNDLPDTNEETINKLSRKRGTMKNYKAEETEVDENTAAEMIPHGRVARGLLARAALASKKLPAWMKEKKPANKQMKILRPRDMTLKYSLHNKEETEINETFTRKHFQQVANTVRAIEDPVKRQEFSDHHAAIFASQNPRFDHKRWHAAAGTKTKEERGIKEEALDELSAQTLKSYSKKAYDDLGRGVAAFGRESVIKNIRRVNRRTTGLKRAARHLNPSTAGSVKFKEETELDEISDDLMRRYHGKARKNLSSLYGKRRRETDIEKRRNYSRKIDNRVRGTKLARDRFLNRRPKPNEETELDETKQAGRYVQGRRLRLPANRIWRNHERRYARFLKRRIAKGDRDTGKKRKALREISEANMSTGNLRRQLQELSKGLVGRYVKKAIVDKEAKREKVTDNTVKQNTDMTLSPNQREKLFNQNHKLRGKIFNRAKGIQTGVDKLVGKKVKVPAKEETEIQELSQDLLGKYATKAVSDMRARTFGDPDRPARRQIGINRAIQKLMGDWGKAKVSATTNKHVKGGSYTHTQLGYGPFTRRTKVFIPDKE